MSSTSSRKVAVVTGANKGIGFAIVRGLCKQFDGDVFLTARNEGRGKEAVKALEGEGLSPKFHLLDSDDAASVETLKAFLTKEYGGLDVLVNNAGMAFKGSDTTPFATQVEVTMKTNYFGLLSTCEILFPILRPGARVVHLSSMTSTSSFQRSSPEIKARILAADSVPAITQIMNDFTKAAKNGTHEKEGWVSWGYGMTKVGVRKLAEVQQKTLSSDSRADIVVNSCCPGYVDTDMTSHKGHKTPDQGADTPIYMSLLPPDTDIRGCFASDRTVGKWE